MKFKLSRQWIALPVLVGIATVAAACGGPDPEPMPGDEMPPTEQPGEPGEAPGEPGEEPAEPADPAAP